MRALFRRRASGLHASMHPSYALDELLALESAIRLEAQTEAWLDGGRSMLEMLNDAPTVPLMPPSPPPRRT